jgi:hypothetical protein
MINRAVERRSTARAIGTSGKLLLETIFFFSELTCALDHEGEVIAWNQVIAGFTGVEPKDMLGKGEGDIQSPSSAKRHPSSRT